MSKKWLPPTPCPIEKHMAGHYRHPLNNISSKPHTSVYKILEMLRSRNKRPKTYYRLFAKRTSEKKQKKLGLPPTYCIYAANGDFVRSVKTKREALRLLEQDSIWTGQVRNPFARQRQQKVVLETGSYVIKFKGEFWDFEMPSTDSPYPVVAVKRCGDNCRGVCTGCSLLLAIKYAAPKWRWWGKMEYKKYLKEQKKREQVNFELSKILKKN